MKTFAQLLTAYAERTGITDAELARHLGVRRQTIFRWKEGLTKRPRDRQDVLRLADKLRLSPAERDELLLAAGFAPETSALAGTTPAGGDAASAPTPGEIAPSSPHTLPWRWLLIAGVVLLLGLSGLLIWEMQQSHQTPYTSSIALGPTAAPGETLILIGQFANYGGEKLGYNVAGRLAEALRDQLQIADMNDVRVQPIPEIIADQQQAEKLARAQNASLIIWGEYDSGRVLAHVTPLQRAANPHELQRMIEDAADLNAAINAELPAEVRWLALVSLGQIAYMNGNYDQAQKAFHQALQQHPENIEGLDIVYFYLALLAERKPDVDLDEIIAYYTQAIDLSPGFISALSNRSAAYLRRRSPGDHERSIADLRRVVTLAPDEAGGHYNLGWALSKSGPAHWPEALAAFQQAYALAPDSPGVNNALCWTHALLQQPQKALPFCDQAVALDSSGASNDSRGVVRAQLGDFQGAIADFQYFLEHYQNANPQAYAHYAPARRAWIQALQAGENPFDAETLINLAAE